MKLLITGGSGFVGRQFLKDAPLDWQIMYLGRSEIQGASACWLQCDLSDSISCEKAARQATGESYDAIVHLAAFVPKTADQDTLSNAVSGNITATINLLNYFGDKTEKIIIGSTAEVYDPMSISGSITESAVVAGGSYYGSTKMSSELIAQSYAKKHKKQLTILRFSVMYGGYDSISRALPNFIRSAKAGDPVVVYGADSLRDYVHIKDVSRSIFCAIASDGVGVVNIGSGRGVKIEDAARDIVRLVESDSTVEIGSRDGGVDIVMDITKAESALQYHPTVFFPDKLQEMIGLYD